MNQENVKKVRNALNVQTDLLRLSTDSLVEKYTESKEMYEKFLNGATSIFSPISYEFFLDFCRDGLEKVLENGPALEDENLELKETYLKAVVHSYDGLTTHLSGQYRSVQAETIGQYEVEYEYFLMNMPGLFEDLMSGQVKTKRDSRHLSAIAYLANHFKCIVLDPEFDNLVGDISRRTIRRESKHDRNPVKYRKAGRCARRWVDRRRKENIIEKNRQKTL